MVSRFLAGRRSERPRGRNEYAHASELSRVHAAWSSLRPAVYGGLMPPLMDLQPVFNGLPSCKPKFYGALLLLHYTNLKLQIQFNFHPSEPRRLAARSSANRRPSFFLIDPARPVAPLAWGISGDEFLRPYRGSFGYWTWSHG